MDLLLHVGLHKTATTTAQACLYENTQALKDQGILYPSTGLWGAQHALIPYCLMADHPFVDRSIYPSQLQYYLDSLRVELDQYYPSLVVISSEAFTETIESKAACLQLIKNLSMPFSRITILLSLRDSTTKALSSLKHMLREHFAESALKFNDAFLNPVATFFEIVSQHEKAILFWHESGIPVYERHVEKVVGSLPDYYFGDTFDQYNSNSRKLLYQEANPVVNSSLRLNADDLIPVTYLVLFLLGNANNAEIFIDKNILSIIVEECQASTLHSGLCDSVNHNQLLGYFDYFSTGCPALSPQHILIPQKLKALFHAGLSQLEILDLFTLLHRVRLRVAIG